MTLTRDPALLYGGDYNAEQWPESVWLEDARLMREAGVNLVTVGVFSWALLEPRPGCYDFGWLDRLLDLLHEHGIAVDLATATAAPPAWLVRQHPDVLPVTAEGVRLEFGSRQHFCPSSQTFREYAAELTGQLARRYAEHPAVAMWHVGNEYGDHVTECFCPRSAEDFRAWLTERYGDVDALNEAWGTTFWGQRYGDLAEVEPPRLAPAPPNPAQSLDWRRFCSDALLACYENEKAVLDDICPGLRVTTNFMGLFGALDYWQWAAHEDVVSNDAYPDPNDPEAHVAIAMSYDLMRSLRHGQPWLLLESAPSAVSWRDVNVPKPPGLRRLWSMQALAHGADGIMFFQWRASRSGAEKFHSAMLPHRGTRARGWTETVGLGADLQSLAEVTDGRSAADVAVLLDWDSWWGLELTDHPSQRLHLKEILTHWYHPLWTANLMVDFARPDADLDAYRLVLAPSLYLLPDATATTLAGYVERGGHLVVGCFSGIVDEHDRAHPGALSPQLQRCLGIEVDEWWPVADGTAVSVDCHGTPGHATTWSEWLEPTTADTWGTYASGHLDGRAAVTRNRHGAGSAWYVSCQLDRPSLAHLLERVADEADARPVLATPPAVEATLRRNDRGTYLFLLNHGESPAEVTLPAPGTDLLDRGREALHTLTLGPRQPAVLRLDDRKTCR
ncbi:MAG TPA: beta-galactosidase [Segeticoccus sp.]|uniref:beta-galactosidase n=1 Tax=Segeticoccus sp. TaxID=2706531 RepID=UPI002D7F2860|nr:beta-galactosidase [Segeticoccus sp.]HET8598861.1 beta-galactosidase [Segeticoccus sp.]